MAFLIVIGVAGYLVYKNRQNQWQHEAQLAWGRGNRALELEDTSKAINEYTHAVTLWPEFAAAYVSRGNAQLTLMAFDKATADYETAIGKDPNYPESYLSRGMLNWLVGKLDPAETDFRKLVRLRPDEPFYLGRLGVVLVEQKKMKEWEDVYRQAYALDRSREWALTGWLAAISSNQGHERLLSEIEQLEARGVRNDDISYYKGIALVSLKRFTEAIPSLEHVVNHGDPAKVPTDAAFQLADAYKASGRADDCRKMRINYFARMGRPNDANPQDCN